MATKRKVNRSKQAKAKLADHPAIPSEKCETGAPIEHYRGERSQHGTTGDPGDIEQETLDPRAPFNKTYGR